MPKRNSVEENLNNLSQGDIDANAAKAAALATIPEPIWDSAIPFETTFVDRVFNARDEASDTYEFERNKSLYFSLKEKGLEKRGDTLCFHFEPDPVTGLMRRKTLVGNIRWSMMDLIRRQEIKRRAEANEPASPETLPFHHIFGLVYTGLTHGQQVALMADHIGRKGLNEYELCKEIGEVIEHNALTDAQASVHFGMDKNKVRRYRMRWALPTVMAEFRKEKAGKDSKEAYISIGQKQLDALHSAYLTDRESGNKHRQEGPAFRIAWEKIISDPEAFKTPTPKPTGPESKDRSQLINQASVGIATFGSGWQNVAINDTLRYAAGEDVSLNIVRQTAKDEADRLASEITRLGTDRDNMALQVEALTIEVTSLRAENETLKASRKRTK